MKNLNSRVLSRTLKWLFILFHSLSIPFNSLKAQEKSPPGYDTSLYKKPTLPDCRPNQLALGFATIFEDSYKRFNTYGPSIQFMHPVSDKIGLTGDVGIYLGSSQGVDYTKIQLYGGINLIPPYQENIRFSPHFLLGATDISSKYTIGTFTSSSSSIGFSVLAGTNIVFPINHSNSLIARVDYNPGIGSGGLKNNFLVGIGYDFGLGCTSKHPGLSHKAGVPMGGSFEVVFPDKKEEVKTSTHPGDKPPVNTTTQEKTKCKASPLVSKLDINFKPLELAITLAKEVTNKIPRLELKVSPFKPSLTITKGEECCSDNKPPANYTEFKGSISPNAELILTLWGLPDLEKKIDCMGLQLDMVAKFKLTLSEGGEFNFGAIGKLYTAGLTDTTYRSDCPSCWYVPFSIERTLKLALIAEGGVTIGSSSGGEEEKEGIKLSGEASGSIGASFTGTYAPEICKTPKPGFHGTFNIGKCKLNLKLGFELGIIGFDYSYEYPVLDGYDFTF